MTAFDKWLARRLPKGWFTRESLAEDAWNAALRWERSKRCVWRKYDKGRATWIASCAAVCIVISKFCPSCGRKVEVKK